MATVHLASLAVLIAAIVLQVTPAIRFPPLFRLVTTVPHTVPIVSQRPGWTWLQHHARVEHRDEDSSWNAAWVTARPTDPSWVSWRLGREHDAWCEARWTRSAGEDRIELVELDGARMLRVVDVFEGAPPGGRFGLARRGRSCALIVVDERAGVMMEGAPDADHQFVLATGIGAVAVRDLAVGIELKGPLGGKARAGGLLITGALAAAWLAVATALVAGRRRIGTWPAPWLALVGAAATFSPLFPMLLPLMCGAIAIALALGQLGWRCFRDSPAEG